MKYLLPALLLLPTPVFAQQVNQFAVCTQNQEVYTPGRYDKFGNFVPGAVTVQTYNVPCNAVNQGYRPANQYYSNGYAGNGGYGYYRPRRVCNPTAGALLGAGIAGAIAGGSSRTWSGNWYNNYSRNGSSGGWSNTESNNYSWQALGAGLGALMFSC